MMPLAIDPSEMRAPARPAKIAAKAAAPRRSARPLLLVALGCVGIVGLSAGSYAMLSGLAGPQATKIKVGRMAADMPDLRDGVPALVPSPTTVRSPDAPVAPAAVATALRSADVPPRVAEAPVTTLAAKPDAPAKPARVLPIENAVLVAPSRTAALVPVVRTAALVAPSAGETTRSRVSTIETNFAALPPEPAATEAPAPRKKPAPVAAPRAKAPAAKPATAPRVATAAPDSPPSAAAEAEETEIFGMKVPSLAPAGRKFVEGVQAFGDAVKSLPDRF